MIKTDTIFDSGKASALEWLQATQLKKECLEMLEGSPLYKPVTDEGDRFKLQQVVEQSVSQAEYHSELALTGGIHKDKLVKFVI